MKNRLIIEAGTELRPPAGMFAAWTLMDMQGPAVTITENGTPVMVGATIGSGAVVIVRPADGSSDDTWVEFDDGEAGTGTVVTYEFRLNADNLEYRAAGAATWANLGNVRGPKGDQGPAGAKGDPGDPGPAGAQGATGRGIATVAVSSGHLAGTYSDGTGWDAGMLPAGSGGLDTEAVQDIVGGMVRAGTGTSVAYDDAAGTLTVSVAAGGAISLSTVQPSRSNFIRTGARINSPFNQGSYAQYTAQQPVAFGQLITLPDCPPITVEVRGAGGALLASGSSIGEGTAVNPKRINFGQRLSFPSGATFSLLVYGGAHQNSTYYPIQDGYTATSADGKLKAGSVDGQGYFIYAFDFADGDILPKNVTGPLDPADFPAVAAVSDIPNGGGARLRGTNNFYLRRDTGQLLEFIGTPVSG